MREIRLHGSEGGGAETNRSFLPLSKRPDITKMGELVVLRVFGTDDIVPGHVAVWLPEP